MTWDTVHYRCGMFIKVYIKTYNFLKRLSSFASMTLFKLQMVIPGKGSVVIGAVLVSIMVLVGLLVYLDQKSVVK